MISCLRCYKWTCYINSNFEHFDSFGGIYPYFIKSLTT